MLLLKNGKVLIGDVLEYNDVLINDDRVVLHTPEISDAEARAIAGELPLTVVDLNGCWLVPGAVDTRVHLRQPGYANEETVKTGTLAAAKGGVTCIMSTPDLRPVPDTMDKLRTQQNYIASDAVVRVFPYAAMIEEGGKKAVDARAMRDAVRGFYGNGFLLSDDAFERFTTDAGGRVIVSFSRDSEFGTAPEAEWLAVKYELSRLPKTVPYHFCGLSLKKSFDLIRKAKRHGYDVTCDVTPNHLFLDETAIINTNYKTDPPLRSPSERADTVKALLSGAADFVASNHRSCSPETKSKDYFLAPEGILGLETLFPLVYTYLVKTGVMTCKMMIEKISYSPARRFLVPCGMIQTGGLADFAALDIDHPHTYTAEEIRSLSHNAPYVGRTLYGFNKLTLVGGKIVFKADDIVTREL